MALRRARHLRIHGDDHLLLSSFAIFLFFFWGGGGGVVALQQTEGMGWFLGFAILGQDRGILHHRFHKGGGFKGGMQPEVPYYSPKLPRLP